jgi:hypothetical protein
MTRRFFASHDARCYTTADAIRKLNLTRRTFFRLKSRGELPLDELLPRLGRVPRYRAEPIDRWLAGGGVRRAS